MGDFIQAIGQGIAGLMTGALETIGYVLRTFVDSLNAALPGGWLAVVVFFGLLGGAWVLARR
jgi:hypothetical protein